VRQFFSPRFWLTLAALGGLALALVLVFHNSGAAIGRVDPPKGNNPERTIDLVSWVYDIVPAPGFTMQDGRATTDLALQLDGTRVMRVKAGTPGEITCTDLTKVANCTVAADLLGDAVLWFSIVPGPPGATVQLPGVTELLTGNYVRLANDWVVRRASLVQRSCPDDTTSLTDFVATYGAKATSTFNFDQQRIVTVVCPGGSAGTTTTTTPVPSGTGPDSSVPVDNSTPGTGEPG